ncbi:hypothetical protein BST61_g1401 [Cercospora zeina]
MASDRDTTGTRAGYPSWDNLSTVRAERQQNGQRDIKSDHFGPLGIHHGAAQEFLRRRSSGVRSVARRWQSSDSKQDNAGVHAQIHWQSKPRPRDDDDEPTWWFASTAIPLLAATLGPLANVLSIAALVTYWRMCLVRGVSKIDAHECAWNGNATSLRPELQGREFVDPGWCYNLNIVSLVFGFVGNFFLLCNFTNRIRYVVALPGTIVCWSVATGVLIGITISMELYTPPTRPQQTYTQGFWYAILAAVSYFICAAGLMVNMLGFWRGHYPHRFTLTDSQRTLILQTMMFFVWLGAGGAIFSAVEGGSGTRPDEGSDDDGTMVWSFVNALYFADVTILTVGFGDLYPETNLGRGLVLPYSVGGIVILGLMVSSITAFVRDLGTENVVKAHKERTRARTIDRTAKTSLELERMRTGNDPGQTMNSTGHKVEDETSKRKPGFQADDQGASSDNPPHTSNNSALRKAASWVTRPPVLSSRPNKLVLLRAEKDRFEAMRRIQESTSRFKKWYALLMSVLAFGFLWCVGAIVFWQAEKKTANEMTYFKALYLGYVALLTIGYGDLAPKSNAGRPFFVFWSLIAVPTMTILVGDLSDTIVKQFKRGTSGIADFTVLPQRGIWHELLKGEPRVVTFWRARRERKKLEQRREEGLPYGPGPEGENAQPTIEELASEDMTRAELAERLAEAIKRVSRDVKNGTSRKYTYEEWVDITQLIRFTAGEEESELIDDEDLIEWDWLGDRSPMMADKSEAEFVLDRLCESVARYVRRTERALAGDENRSECASVSAPSRETGRLSMSHPHGPAGNV